MSLAWNPNLLTEPEKKVYYALKSLDIEFEVQVPMMGGREQKGGVIVDFFLYDLKLVLSVIGKYWHRSRQAIDLMQREALLSNGINTIFIDEEAALSNARYYVEEAILGIDHSKIGGGK